jgi:hypothetical protein
MLQYNGNCWQKYIFEEIVEDCGGVWELAEINYHPKSVYSFWKIIPIDGNGDGDKKLYHTS